MARDLSGKLATVNLYSVKEKLKPENISLKKHSTAFAQVSVLLRVEQKDGKVTTDHHLPTSNFKLKKNKNNGKSSEKSFKTMYTFIDLSSMVLRLSHPK